MNSRFEEYLRNGKNRPGFSMGWRLFLAITAPIIFIKFTSWYTDRRKTKTREKAFAEIPETDFEGLLTSFSIGRYIKSEGTQGEMVFKPSYYQYNKAYDIEDLRARFEILSMRQKISEIKKQTKNP